MHIVVEVSLKNGGSLSRNRVPLLGFSQKEYCARFSAKLADRLRNLRSEHHLSQEKVAYLAGISAYTYQKFEKGESKPGTPMNPRLYTLISLADVFGMDVPELLRFEE
jgi:DNA-binding XRE family transcriptional regulator